MKVTIDRDECISCGTCWEHCPEFFEEGLDDGMSQVVEAYCTGGDWATGDAPDDLDCVRTAADLCPVEIIHVQD